MPLLKSRHQLENVWVNETNHTFTMVTMDANWFIGFVPDEVAEKCVNISSSDYQIVDDIQNQGLIDLIEKSSPILREEKPITELQKETSGVEKSTSEVSEIGAAILQTMGDSGEEQEETDSSVEEQSTEEKPTRSRKSRR